MLSVLSLALAAPSFSRVGDAADTEIVNAKFFIKLFEGAADSCDSALMEAATPGSAAYGHWWSFEEVGAKLGGNPEHLKGALRLFNDAGFSGKQLRISPNREIVSVRGSVAQFEELLTAEGVNFGRFVHDEEFSGPIVAPDSDVFAMHLSPTGLGAHVDGVAGLALPTTKPSTHAPHFTEVVVTKRQQPTPLSTPSMLRNFYNVQPVEISDVDATQSIFASLGQAFDPKDLATFQSTYSISSNPIATVVGVNDPSACSDPNSCIEASLDVQQITMNDANTTFWSVAESNDLFVEWIEAVAAMANPPLVHSISYGAGAKEDPKNDMVRFNTEVCKATLRGLTIMVSSGDDGAAGSAARSDPSACSGTDPSYPATSPYVTAVGATQGPENGSPEVVCQSDKGGVVTSGGGFSNTFATPAYQASAASNYVAQLATISGAMPQSYYNPMGRMYPDVALEGTSFPVIVGGQTYNVAGTSASSPLFASFVTLMNSARLTAGKPPVGFLNPFIYQNCDDSSLFNDVTVGVNRCAAGRTPDENCCSYGFNATASADAATGCGSINVANIIAKLVSM